MKLNIIFFLGIVVLGGLSCTDSGKNQLKVEDDYFINPIFLLEVILMLYFMEESIIILMKQMI